VTGEQLDGPRRTYLLAQVALAATALRWARRALDLARQGDTPLPDSVRAALTAALSSATVAAGEVAHLRARLERQHGRGSDAGRADEEPR
jgi:hypothetical protein